MGRRKITIKQIPDVKLRHITFNKRKNGLFKKAAELSVLCNLNLLLVCEDGLGNLIRFSKSKITDLNSFIDKCSYQHVIDLTSEDYPDFSKINRKKDKDRDDTESGQDEETPVQLKEESSRKFTQVSVEPKPSTKTRQRPPSNIGVAQEDRKGSSQRPRLKTSDISDDLVSQTSNGPDSVQKKNKNRPNLRLKIPKQEGVPESQNTINTFTSESTMRMPSVSIEQSNTVSDRARKPSDNQPMPMRGMESQPMRGMESQPMRGMENQPMRGMENQPMRGMEKPEFTSPSFMPFTDPMKRFGNIYETATSPFKFYPQNVRMEPLSAMLKGLSPFNFPTITGTPIMQRTGYGEGDDRYAETASALKMMGRVGMGPETGNSATSNKVFTFQHEDSIPSTNQMSSRNDHIYGNQRHIQNPMQMQNQMHDYINLPSVIKSEPDFELNMAPETLSAKRFNFDGYFKDTDDGTYPDLRKKYKLT